MEPKPTGIIPDLSFLWQLAEGPTAIQELTRQLPARGAGLRDYGPSQFEVYTDGTTQMILDEDRDQFVFGRIRIVQWDGYDSEEYEEMSEYVAHRADFDLCFEREVARAVAALGPPAFKGQEDASYATRAPDTMFRFIAWEAATSLLALGQSGYDPQMGMEISYFLRPKGREPVPEPLTLSWFLV